MSAFGPYIVGVVVAVFMVIGFIRGWYREVIALAGLVVGWAIVLFGGQVLVLLVDRAYLMLASTVRGLFDSPDPGAILRQLRANPLVDPAHPDPLYAVVFALVVVGIYVGGTRYAPGPDGLPAKLLGVPVGLMNGYLVAYALLRFAAPVAFRGELAGTTGLIGQYVNSVLVLGVAVVAAGLIMARGRGRGAGLGRARARSRG
jgi:hypothetical protein